VATVAVAIDDIGRNTMIRRISLAVLAAAVLRCSIPAEAETFT